MLVVFLLLVMVSGQQRGLCPAITTVVNVNITKMSGLWFDQAHSRRALEVMCDQVKFTALTDDGRLTFRSISYSNANKSTIVTSGTADVTPEGGLMIDIPALRLNSSVAILGVDYNSYTVLWSCSPRPNDSHMDRWIILTRTKIANMTVINRAVRALQESDVSTSSLTYSIHRKCPQYNFNVTEESRGMLGYYTSMGSLLPAPREA